MVHANPLEVYLLPLGKGVHLAVFGVKPEYRPALEGNFGYLLLSNGVPIGYGGVSPLFHQANTGISIFEEYRRSEAAYLFAHTLRAFHGLFHCTRFIVSPYQFGEGNADAIGSGAFWFYYRLGFRPVDRAVSRQARKEWERLSKHPGEKTKKELLRTWARGDMVFRMASSRVRDDFPDEELVVCSRGVTELLAASTRATRDAASTALTRRAVTALAVRSFDGWTRDERRAFERMAPVVLLCSDLSAWAPREKKRLVALMRTQGWSTSRTYITRLRRHNRFRASLTNHCRAQALDRLER